MGTFAARTAVNAGSSVHIAAREVAKKIKQIAAELMEVSADDLELRDGFARGARRAGPEEELPRDFL